MIDIAGNNRVRIPKAAEIVAGHIRKSIVRGELKPGDKLPQEASLISEYDVSRPSIREAIRILESEGLITVSRGANGGARVRALTGDLVTRAAGLALQALGATIEETYIARTLIEPPAARLAAETRGKQAAAALRAHIEREQQLQDPTSRALSLAQFHHLLMEESGNKALAVVGQALQGVVERHMLAGYRLSMGNQSDPQHARWMKRGVLSRIRLVDLIEAGDGPGAEQHWHEHMKVASTRWLSQIGKSSVIDVFD